MADDFARSVQIMVSLAGNIEGQLANINKIVDQLSGKKISISSEPINQLTNSAKGASSSIGGISDAAKKAESNTSSSFKSITGNMKEVNEGIGNMVQSLAGMAIGGSIAGYSWMNAAKSNLYTEGVYKAIDANKKLKITHEQLAAAAAGEAAEGASTKGEATKELYKTLNIGGSKLLGKGDEALANAKAINDFYFSRQEMMAEQGIGDAEQLVRMATRTPGKMMATQARSFATAIGVDVDDKSMKTAKGRMKLFMEKGAKVDMGVELDERPWIRAETSMNKLKKSIGVSLMGPLSALAVGFSKLIEVINAIPGGSALIGWAAMALTAVSALGLLNSVLTPGIALLKSMVLWTKAQVAADWLGIGTKQAKVASELAATTSAVMLTGAMEGEFLAEEMATVGAGTATTANVGLAASLWAVVSPLLVIIVPLVALAALLYLVESKTHIFSNALKTLGKSQMATDVIQWFKDIGYWINEGIKGVDNFYKMLKSKGTVMDVIKLGLSVVFAPLTMAFSVFRVLLPLIQGDTKMISDTIVFIKGLIDTGFGIVSRVYNTLVKGFESLVTFFKELPTSLANSIKGMLPGWAGGGNPAQTPEIAKSAIDIGAGVTSATTQEQAAQMALDLAKQMYPDRDEASIQEVTNAIYDYLNAKRLGASQDVLDGLNAKLKNFTPVSKPLTSTEGFATPTTPTGFIPPTAPATPEGFAKGGFVRRSGMALVHSGEPIIPAVVANSSRLQNILESIAYGGSSTTNNQGDINVNINYTSPSGMGSSNMIVMDKISFEKMVSDVITQKLRQRNGY